MQVSDTVTDQAAFSVVTVGLSQLMIPIFLQMAVLRETIGLSPAFTLVKDTWRFVWLCKTSQSHFVSCTYIASVQEALEALTTYQL